jgi:hypothetical protein
MVPLDRRAAAEWIAAIAEEISMRCQSDADRK